MSRPPTSRMPAAAAMRSAVGMWVGASLLLHRPVPVDGPYPHVCGSSCAGVSGAAVRVGRRGCAACAQPRPVDDRDPATPLADLPPAPDDPQMRAAGDGQD